MELGQGIQGGKRPVRQPDAAAPSQIPGIAFGLVQGRGRARATAGAFGGGRGAVRPRGVGDHSSAMVATNPVASSFEYALRVTKPLHFRSSLTV